MDAAQVDVKLRAAFMAFDQDADGCLTDGEYLMCIRSMGLHIPRSEEGACLLAAGLKPGETAKFDTVLQAALKFCVGKDPRGDLMKQFKQFDRKGDGTIQALELQQVLASIGEILNDTERVNCCKVAAAGGLMNYEKFVDAML